jgi:predicted glycosyltransferase
VPAKSLVPRQTVWIDLENTPHIPFFRPIIRELEARGLRVVLTAREAFQTVEMAQRYGLKFTKVGRHYGQNSVMKIAGLATRAMQLMPFILRERPSLALSHGSRGQILASNLTGIPTVLVMDYEHSRNPPMTRPRWEIVPDVITDEMLHTTNKTRARRYAGIKEDVYVPEFKPDAAIVDQLGLRDRIVVTVRPPATEAHYHNPEAEALFDAFMERVCARDDVRAVLLPRNRAQREVIEATRSHWFKDSKVVIPRDVVDGLNLLWHSDFAVSGGGTMNREAAALGVPVYSIFRGKMGAVDRALVAQQRLVMIENVEQVASRIRVEKRVRGRDDAPRTSRALTDIVDHVVDILSIEKPALKTA